MKFIQSFISYLKSEKNYSVNTLVAYERDLEQFMLYISAHHGLDDLSLLDHPHIRSWIVYLMKDHYTAKSVNRKMSSLKSFFRYLKKKGHIHHNPMSKVVTPKIGKRLPVYVQEKVMNRPSIVSTDLNDFSTTRDDMIIEILYNTGIRRTELIHLKETDINYSRQEIRVLGKGNKDRVIPVTSNLLEQIKRYVSIKDEQFALASEYLIVTDKGVKAYPKFIYNKVHGWLSNITTLEKRSPHVLRHTFATHMANNGADLNAIKAILGHSSLASTQVYTHNTVDQLKRVYKKAHPKAK